MTDFSKLADFSWYAGNLPWLKERTIFLTVHGSHAYGTNMPESDVDLKGVAVAPREFYLGFLRSFEQSETKEPIDATIFGIRKFFKLASDGNPNIIEILFTDQADWLTNRPALWGPVYAARHLFLSQLVRKTFLGYAFGQLDRIRTHRAWLLNPPKKWPERADFGLSNTEGTIRKHDLNVLNSQIKRKADSISGKGHSKAVLETHEAELVTNAIEAAGLSLSLVETVLAERRYAAARQNWESYLNWQKNRNPKRAALEAKFGYDTKHAMHLVRLLRMAKEILRDGQVIVKRPDAAELLRVRAGDWTFDQLMEYARNAELDLEIAAANSPLPEEPDRQALDNLLVGIMSEALR
jgi:predicted nucleotidyltransferase